MKKLYSFRIAILAIGCFLSIQVLRAQVTLSASSGTPIGNYPTLSFAFDMINNGTHKGIITILINADITETYTAFLNRSGIGMANYNFVRIMPTVSGLTVSGDIAGGPIIDFNGVSNVTIDGSMNGHDDVADLTISNMSSSSIAGTSTIRFTDAMSNTIKYCKIKGSETSTSSGTIFFAAGNSGNSGNVISNNIITNASESARPINSVFSQGYSTFITNDDCSITNNSFYNFFNPALSSYGINLSLNTTRWTIEGNSFYETTSFAPTLSNTSYCCININSATGAVFNILNNYLGGSAIKCGGSAFTKTAKDNTFYGISVNVGTTSGCFIQGNTITNFNWTNSTVKDWTGIYVAAGSVDVGTNVGNVIGSATGNGAITITMGQGLGYVYGIKSSTTGTVNIKNNIIGSVTILNTGADYSSAFFGIYRDGNTGVATISNNSIGSTDAATNNSINISCNNSTNNPTLCAIGVESQGTTTVLGNTISKLSQLGTTNTSGVIKGIFAEMGTNIIKNNTIKTLTVSNSNTATFNSIPTICGIAVNISMAAAQTISGNTISNLINSSNQSPTTTADIAGLYFNGTTIANSVSGNYISDILENTNSVNRPNIYGIQIKGGLTTYSNNIVNLKADNPITIYGIYETGAIGNNNSLYFNTVHIGGVPTTGSSNSYALYSNASTNIRNFRNNLLYNLRDNNGPITSKHYALYLNYNITSGLTMDYNDYITPGIAGIPWFYNNNPQTDLETWKIITAQDANSLSIEPSFATTVASAATDFRPTVDLIGVSEASVLTDYSNKIRPSIPTIGALEIPSTIWTGTTSTDWNVSTNWTGGIPTMSVNAFIPSAPVNQPIISTNTECKNVVIEPTSKLTINSSKTLFTRGDFLLKSNSSGVGTLIDNGTLSVSGMIQVEQYLGGARNWYIASPVWGATVPLGQTYYTYDEKGNNTGYVAPATANWTAVRENSYLSIGKGYIAQPTAATTLTYWGTAFNTGDQSIPLTWTSTAISPGFNLVANPYPSYLDWTLITADAANSDISTTLWYRTQTTGGTYTFSTYNSSGNVVVSNNANTIITKLIPPMQAFWVRVNDGVESTNLTLRNTMRTHGDDIGNRQKAPAASEEKILRIQVSNGLNSDESVLYFNINASDDYDKYDSPKMNNDDLSIPKIYTIVGKEKLVINGMRDIPYNTEIPLGFIAGNSSNYKIKANEVNGFGSDTQVVLIDKTTSSQTYLSPNTEYNFSSDASSGTGRFSIVFKLSSVVANLENIANPNYYLQQTSDRGVRIVSRVYIPDTEVSVYSVMGQRVYNSKLSSADEIIQNSFSTGVYLFIIKSAGKSFKIKMIIK